MIHCDICHQVVALADQHRFDGATYCPTHCPQCQNLTGAMPAAAVVEPGAVDRAKRGHRRGTPRSWALRGAGS